MKKFDISKRAMLMAVYEDFRYTLYIIKVEQIFSKMNKPECLANIICHLVFSKTKK